VSHLVVSDLAYALPGGDLLFSEVSFKLATGQHAGLVGANGVGRSTLLKVVAGRLAADAGQVSLGGPVAVMPQDVGVGGDGLTVRKMLLGVAPPDLRDAGRRMGEAELPTTDPDPEVATAAGLAFAEADLVGDRARVPVDGDGAQVDDAPGRIVAAQADLDRAWSATGAGGGPAATNRSHRVSAADARLAMSGEIFARSFIVFM